MRKVFSILLALGLVLGMVAAAAPAAAQAPDDWTAFSASVANPCEFELSNYTFRFTPTADLHSGTHSITIGFPEGTGFPEVWRNGHITVNTEEVFGTEVTRDGNDVTFLLPLDIVGPDVLVTVMFQTVSYAGQTTGIRNPAAGTYFYFVKTSRAPNSEWVRSGWSAGRGRYISTRIQPAVATYAYTLDFGATYPGIAVDFIPPFKACGQESDYNEDWEPGASGTPYDTFEFETGKWANNFTLTFGPGYGCGFCRFDTSMVLTSAPYGGVVTVIGLGVAGNETETMEMVLDGDRIDLLNDGDPIDDDIEWELAMHFDKVGTYEICFEAWTLDNETCVECQDVQRCETFEVKQWKDAIFIELGPKWNLMSLPIVPFDTSIASILAPIEQGWFAYLSTWHYDRCLDEWFVDGNGQTSLETIEDGKSYWTRMMKYDEYVSLMTLFVGHLDPGDGSLLDAMWTQDGTYDVSYLFGEAPGYATLADLELDSLYGPPWKLWIWGTETPMPPAGPSAYLQCEGWNMLGFRSVIDRLVGGVTGTEYLYGHTFGEHYTAVYGWDGTAWQSKPDTSNMEVGMGYWVYWQEQRTVNPPL